MWRTDLSGILDFLTGGPAQRPAGGDETAELLFLQGGRSFTVNTGGAPVCIRTLGGTLWITVEGDSRDHVLGRGETAAFNGTGRLVVTAFENAQIRICREPDGAPDKFPLTAPACP